MAQSRYSTVKYMLVELMVEDKHHLRFIQRMPGIIRQIAERYRWEFIYAAYPLSGRLNKFVHIWRIRGEEDVLKLMVDAAVDFREDGEDESAHNFALAYRDIQDLISSTRHVFMAALPHDPNQLGEQTHTVVIDQVGKLSIIEHASLDDPAHEIPTIDPKRNADLDAYLRRGVTCGLLKASESVNGSNLFYNLASLKPLSVYQLQRLGRSNGATVVIPFPNSDIESGGKVILASTNGKVYALNADAMTKVAKEIPQEEREQTEAIMRPLIEGKVPLAHIPTPRIVAVGEGCLCFVINLQAFAR